ncbi:MAG: acetate--CoA ligase family protein [Bacteroidales bacterium]|nr:acetate--CoA ligase family protein [Bacteroidales bacterium]
MVTQQLIDPGSIAVIGASNNLVKPGGKIYHNIKTGSFRGKLFPVNPNEDEIQGDTCFKDISELPDTELAILAIPAKLCESSVEKLASEKSTRAFIIISAGFSEENEKGAEIERRIASICNSYDAALIGPNCIGVMTPGYQGVFTLPIPRLDPAGCDFISGSGATAVFIMEAGLQKGLKFNSVFSVGNSAQTGVEDVLAYLDETYEEGSSSKAKILYFESIKNPDKLLKHASSLIRKGCRIAAIKAGTSEAGSRAASSHTGALATSDQAVDALFRKAGIIRCYGREELTTVASLLLYPGNTAQRYAIITHAGGPAVMLTDALAEGNLEVPHLEGPHAGELLEKLNPGSSTANPIDVLATGTAEHVRLCLDYCENKFDEIDAVVLIFGTPGLAPVYDVYEELHRHMQKAVKPVYPVLPSVTTAADEVQQFLSYGHMNFQDEVLLGRALVKIRNTPGPAAESIYLDGINMKKIRGIIDQAENGYLSPGDVTAILSLAGIPVVPEIVVREPEELAGCGKELGYPLVMKVVGPVHKTDVGGVELNIKDEKQLVDTFHRMSKIEGFEGALVQRMLKGTELFTGAVYEENYGHIIMCGLGGIFVEVLKDVSTGLAPLTFPEATGMIRSLRSFRMFEGTRGKASLPADKFAEVMVRLSSVLRYCNEIAELDINPLIADKESVTVVDARIRIEK